MDELLRWLGEQLDEDERIAQAATSGPWHVTEYDYATEFAAGIGTSPGELNVVGHGYEGGGVDRIEDAHHIAAHDPARVLREIEAGHELLSRYEAMAMGVLVMTGVESILAEYRRVILPNLALRYTERPGYREEWRP